MEKFKINNKVKFFTTGVFPKKSFNVYSGLDAIKLFEKNIDTLKTTYLPSHKAIVKNDSWHKSDVKLLGEVPKRTIDLLYLEDVVYYESPLNLNMVSLTPQLGFFKKHKFGTTLNSEHYIRPIKNTFLYVQVNFPGDFLRKYLTRIIAPADYQKFVVAMKEYKKSTIANLANIYHKYDNLYNDKFKYKKSNGDIVDLYKWRQDLFFYMTFTIKKLGYFNPVLNSDFHKVFYDGSHRLGVGSAVGYDFPIYLRASTNNYINKELWYCTPAYFNDKAILFSLDIENKILKIYWLDDDDIKSNFKEVDEELLILETSNSFKLLVEKHSKREPDYIYYE